MEPLIVKYRPTNWNEVLGNHALVDSIVPALRNGSSHAYLIYGPTGCGKTTIARLSAYEVGTEEQNIIEINAATNNGIDDMRELIASLNYKPLSGTTKSVIIDECQSITTQAWRALLKSLEEPSSWVYWFLCTTEPTKVPSNIQNRCSLYQVSLLPQSELRKLLTRVWIAENKLVKIDIIQLCAQMAEGSPRRALAYLAQTIDSTLEEAQEILCDQPPEQNDIIALAHYLVNSQGKDWDRIRIILRRLLDQNPESIRRVIESYITKTILDTSDRDRVSYLLALLEDFSHPITTNSLAPIILAATRSL